MSVYTCTLVIRTHNTYILYSVIDLEILALKRKTVYQDQWKGTLLHLLTETISQQERYSHQLHQNCQTCKTGLIKSCDFIKLTLDQMVASLEHKTKSPNQLLSIHLFCPVNVRHDVHNTYKEIDE